MDGHVEQVGVQLGFESSNLPIALFNDQFASFYELLDALDGQGAAHLVVDEGGGGLNALADLLQQLVLEAAGVLFEVGFELAHVPEHAVEVGGKPHSRHLAEVQAHVDGLVGCKLLLQIFAGRMKIDIELPLPSCMGPLDDVGIVFLKFAVLRKIFQLLLGVLQLILIVGVSACEGVLLGELLSEGLVAGVVGFVALALVQSV